MNKYVPFFFIILIFLSKSTFAKVEALPNISGWHIEYQDDNTCAMGNIFNYSERDSIIFNINSYGRISIISDMPFNKDIRIDDNIVHPINTISNSAYSYATNKENGIKVLNKLKSGKFIHVTMINGDNRRLSLSGFSKEYNKYLKYSR